MKVLIIEDEPKIARALKVGLKQDRSTAEVCGDGESGLAAAQAESYDIIVLDRMLPGLDGMKVCRRLRADDISTPIIMLTAKGQTKNKVEGLNAGADDYLTKPFSFDEFLARIHALARRPHETTSDTLQVDDLTLNTITYRVARAGQEISLSATEFALLEYLMRHSGQTFSKTNLIDNVWDYDADILPNTVEAYIGYLRAKVDRPFDRPALLHTVRGFGYRLGTAA